MLLPGFVRHEGEDKDPYQLTYIGISALIQLALLLEELRLDFDLTCCDTLPANFLASLKLPRLQSLGLGLASFQDPSCLVEFLGKHAITLKRVDFENLSLETGS
jgi:hypothetical protein